MKLLHLAQESRIRPFMKALQRKSAGAAAVSRSSQSTPPSQEGQEGGEAREDDQEEAQASAVRSFFEERATGGATRRQIADTMMAVRLDLQEAPFQRSADPVC